MRPHASLRSAAASFHLHRCVFSPVEDRFETQTAETKVKEIDTATESSKVSLNEHSLNTIHAGPFF